MENTKTPEPANKLNKHTFVKSWICEKRECALTKLTLKNIQMNSFRNHPSVQILISIAFFIIMTGIYDHTELEGINDIGLGEVLWDCKSSTDKTLGRFLFCNIK